jgi:plastocyanin
VSVTMDDNVFRPGSVDVAAGSTVVWTNRGRAMHTATADDGSFDSDLLRGGQTYRRTFARPGTFTYTCQLHPEMTGTIRVLDQEGKAPPPRASVRGAAGPGAAGPAAPAAPGTVEVSMRDYDFAPRSVTVDSGGTVRWRNTGVAPHTATDGSGAYDSGMVASGGTFEQVFTTPGAFPYSCTLHPGMNGVVLVRDATGEAPDFDTTGLEGETTDRTPTSSAPAEGEEAPLAVTIEADDFLFDPSDVVLRKGGTVTWQLVGEAPHTVTDRAGAFDTGVMEPGSTYTWTYEDTGTFPYECTLHPGMVGTIRVVDRLLEEAEDGPGPSDHPVDGGDERHASGADAGDTDRGGTPTVPVGMAVAAALPLTAAGGYLGLRLGRRPSLLPGS